ncbi:DUF7287 family protein [Halovivax limisalsi]|uniref:DUF7287 family protein n=1 Tax=Halovivax limisalsi TaxID=1453760 RepID=UPI001FFDE58F|nr:hypothetical protein [Halovivax limisalsi]
MHRDALTRTDGRSSDRGQTVQDFAVGIGLFLLAVAFVFAFVPTIITPFADAGGARTAQADRVASTIVENETVAGEEINQINLTAFENTYDVGEDELAKRLGLRGVGDHVNVTVITLDAYGTGQPANESAGEAYDDQIGASTTRLVTDTEGTCDPVCKLIVRVW